MSFASTSTTTTTTSLDLTGLTNDDQFQSESAWLNSILSSTSNSSSPPNPSLDDATQLLSNLDTKLAKTLALLELATHDTSSLVDRTIEDISRSVPRLTFDLQLMRENALLLRFTLDGVRKRGGIGTSSPKTIGNPGLVVSTGVNGESEKKEPQVENGLESVGFGEDSEVSKVMEKLRVLDLVKSRMEAARDVLREAESWSTLDSEVTALVGESAFGKAAERLEEAARSMIVFQNTTEYEGRRALMVSLQNQLEASLSTSLVAAINNRDVKACKTFYGIFGQIQREVEFTAYYFGSRRSSLTEAWSSAVLEDCSEVSAELPTLSSSTYPPSSIRFTQFLTKFYSDLHSLLNEERTYVPAIFPNPSPTLSSFIQSTLEGLSPSLPQRLSAVSDSYGPLVLPELIVAYKAAEEFAVVVERIMSSLVDDTSSISSISPSTSTSSATPKKDRRLSKRMSISKRSGRSISLGAGSSLIYDLSGGGDGSIRPWETAIFEPFLDWQVDYPDFERKYLEEEIARVTGNQDVMQSLISGESEKGAKVLWEQTLAVFGLAEDAVGRALGLTHGYGAAGLVQVIDEQVVSFMDQRRAELTKARKGGAKVRASNKREDEDELAALEGLEYSTEDWGTFQFGLKLLDICRSITERLGTFEAKLLTRLTSVAHTVKEARDDPIGYSIPGTTKGAVTILRQSGLNSLELANLLTPLEKSSDSSNSISSSLPTSLLPRSRISTTEFTRATQLFLHDTILAPLIVPLRDYANLSAWTTAAPVSKGAYEIAIPTFSLSPSDTISKVGEGLFNLPRLFEVYADDDALAFSLETLPFVDVEALRTLYGPSGIAPPTPRTASSRRMSYTGVESLSSSSESTPRRSSILSIPIVTPLKVLSAETVIATWLSSLTLAILSYLNASILPSINRLSKHGASQLASDLGYISNVARALDVESLEFEAWREMAELEEPRGEDELGGEVEKRVYEKMAMMRGWRRN